MKPLNHSYYPWQQQQWLHLLTLKANAKVPHALLFAGAKGLGKYVFAKCFAQALLCAAGNEKGCCGSCRDCQLYQAGTHPDFACLSPEADSSVIKIDAVRDLIQTANQTPQQAAYKVVIIEPAEAMNTAAANAFLKTLEEPPGQTIFILVSHYAHRLPATIRSRCQTLKFRTPAIAAGVKWLSEQLPEAEQTELMLQLADCSPLLAIKLIQAAYLEHRNDTLKDFQEVVFWQAPVVTVAEKWHKQDIELLLKQLLSFIIDLIRLKYSLNLSYISNKDLENILLSLAGKFEVNSLFKLLDKLYEIKAVSSGTMNINHQLLWEDFLTVVAGGSHLGR